MPPPEAAVLAAEAAALASAAELVDETLPAEVRGKQPGEIVLPAAEIVEEAPEAAPEFGERLPEAAVAAGVIAAATREDEEPAAAEAPVDEAEPEPSCPNPARSRLAPSSPQPRLPVRLTATKSR